MSEVKILYLDMDGVLCNFEKRWIDLFGETAKESRDRKEFSPNWDIFVTTGNFEKLDPFPGSDELLEFVYKFRKQIDIEILSSSGGQKYHNEVSAQKDVYLKKRGIACPRNFVPGRKLKRNFATPNSILIDDTPDVIDAFNSAGGIGILHKDASETINRLKELL
jgi:hypothetical protein